MRSHAMMCLACAAAAVPHLGAPAVAAGAPGGANLVANGSFEELRGGVPIHWEAAGDDAVKQKLSAAAGKVGQRCAELHCSAYSHRGPASHAMLAQVSKVALRKGQMYRFSCRLRAEGLRSRYVRVAISDTSKWANCGLQGGFALARSWRKFEIYFTASRTVHASSRLQFWFAETGTLWVDDVRIVPVSHLKRAFTRRIEPGSGKNLLPNASFECGPDAWASLGKSVGWGNMSGLFGQVVADPSVHGGHCLRIDLGPGKTEIDYFDYFDPVRVVQSAPLAANLGWVKVQRGKTYTLSAHLRAGRDGTRGKLFIRQCDPGGWPIHQTKQIVLSEKWKRFSLSVRAARDYLYAAVGPDLPREDGAATVWIDAVQLERGAAASAFAVREPVEVGLETGRFGNVFFLGEPVRLLVSARNETARGVAVQLKVEAEDFFGKGFSAGAQGLKVPAGGSARSPLALKLSDPGYYLLKVTCVGGVLCRRRMRLAVIQRYEQADSPFGINHAPPTANLCRLLRSAGVVWARDWSWKWQHVEPRQGSFDPAVADAQVNRVLAAGMKQTCLLPPFPSSNWASTAPKSVATGGYPGNRLRMAYAPKDPKLLGEYIEKCVRHCAGRVRVWEFLNEPIFTNYALPSASKGLPGAAYTVADYVRLLKLASAAMRRADPTCRVIGGIAGGPRLLMSEFLAAGGLDRIDILNLHMYPGKAPPETYLEPMAELRRRMQAHGKVRPIWITEYSYYATDELPWEPFVGATGWAAARLLRDERQCADYSVRFAVVMLASGAEKVFYHSGASGEVNRPPLECCLLGYAGLPRKVLAAQAALADVLGPRPRLARRLAAPAEGVYAFAFDCGERAVVAAWVDEDLAGEGWRLTAPAEAEVHDIVGRRAGPGARRLTSSPVYVVARSLSAARLADSCRLARPEG